MAAKTLLVTGAGGFIGQKLVARLQTLPNARLVVLTRQGGESTGNYVSVQHDLDGLTKATWSQHGIEKIDVVFHLAAFTPKRASEGGSIEEIYRSNVAGTMALLGSLPSVPDKIVFSSTLDVYAPLADLPITEESNIGPPNLYGASKLFCESLIRSYANSVGAGYAILRYGHIYGPGEKAYAKLIPEIIRKVIRGETAVVYGDGSTLRDFMYVDDAIEATVRSAFLEGCAIDALNVVSGCSRAIRDIVELIQELAGASTGIEFRKDLPGGASIVFDNARMRSLLGEWNQVPVKEGLAREIKHFRGCYE